MNNKLKFTEEQWDIETINRALRQLPALTSSNNYKALQIESRMKETKHILALEEAAERVRIKTEHTEEKLTAPDVTAMVYLKTKTTRELLLKEETEWEKAKAITKFYADLKDTAMTASGLLREEMRQHGLDSLKG